VYGRRDQLLLFEFRCKNIEHGAYEPKGRQEKLKYWVTDGMAFYAEARRPACGEAAPATDILSRTSRLAPGYRMSYRKRPRKTDYFSK